MARDDKNQTIYKSKKDLHGRWLVVEDSISREYFLYLSAGSFECESQARIPGKDIAAYITKEDAIKLRNLLCSKLGVPDRDGIPDQEEEEYQQLVSKYKE